jgi:O-acetyl-ADP-ribose deacetylase (regulator of RNase III)
MTFDLQEIIESKRRFREQLAARPVAEKLAMLDQLRERALAIRASRHARSPTDAAVNEGRADCDVNVPGPITFVHGDATRPAARPAVIVHVCNDVGGWGAGFVLAISKRWKAPEREFRAAFAVEKKPELGDVQFVAVEPDLWVANMIAQRDIRRGPAGEPPIRYDAVRAGLAKVATFAREHDASIHMPRIGCGLAGGKWAEIEPIIHATLIASGIAVTVYDFS